MLSNNFRLYVPLPSSPRWKNTALKRLWGDIGGDDRVVLPRIEFISLVLIGNFEWYWKSVIVNGGEYRYFWYFSFLVEFVLRIKF